MKRTSKIPAPMPDPAQLKTVYVDLDGTLAYYDEWKGAEVIGDPIEPMMERVRRWLDTDVQVKIFTARFPQHWKAVANWLAYHGLPPLEITNVKGIDGTEFWDDRAVSVEPNTGRYATPKALDAAQMESVELREKVEAVEVELKEAKARIEILTAIHKDAMAQFETYRHRKAPPFPTKDEWRLALLGTGFDFLTPQAVNAIADAIMRKLDPEYEEPSPMMRGMLKGGDKEADHG